VFWKDHHKQHILEVLHGHVWREVDGTHNESFGNDDKYDIISSVIDPLISTSVNLTLLTGKLVHTLCATEKFSSKNRNEVNCIKCGSVA
jgi:hypothetical protein